MKRVLEHQYLQMFGLKLNTTFIVNRHSLKLVGRSSETQPQLSENLDYSIQRIKGYILYHNSHLTIVD